jgi:hypothetical protein
VASVYCLCEDSRTVSITMGSSFDTDAYLRLMIYKKVHDVYANVATIGPEVEFGEEKGLGVGGDV